MRPALRTAASLSQTILLATCFAAIVVCGALSLTAIDSWLLHMTVWEAVLKLLNRFAWVFAGAVFVAIFCSVPATIAIAVAPERVRERLASAIGAVFRAVGFVVIVSAVLSLLLEWLTVMGLAFPSAVRIAIWCLTLLSVAVALAWPSLRGRAWQRVDHVTTGTLSRRTVIGIGASSLAVALASWWRKPVSATAVVGSTPITRQTRPNIILVTFDAMSASDMSLYGYHLHTTPSLAAFARNAVVFDNYFAASTFTGPCVASMLTGRYITSTRTFQQGAQIQDGADRNFIRVLRDAGYNTAASIANIAAFPETLGIDGALTYPTVFPMHTDDLLKLPFEMIAAFDAKKAQTLLDYRGVVDSYLDYVSLAPWPKGHTSIPPSASFDQAEQLLGKLKAPYFLWVHVFAPHAPYQPAPPFAGRFLPGSSMRTLAEVNALADHGPHGLNNTYPPDRQREVDRARLRYDEYICEADAAFGQFLQRLRGRNTENTAILVSADHGESFEGGVYSHGGPHLVRPLIHIPLMVHTPGLHGGRRDPTVADETALAPTILDLAGLSLPEWLATPRSLLDRSASPTSDARFAYTQFFEGNSAFGPLTHGVAGVTDGIYQYIHDFGANKNELGLLANPQANVTDLTPEHPDVAAVLRRALVSRFPSLAKLMA